MRHSRMRAVSCRPRAANDLASPPVGPACGWNGTKRKRERGLPRSLLMWVWFVGGKSRPALQNDLVSETLKVRGSPRKLNTVALPTRE
jgi:hypothetical protein